jgi:pimeloyl-ACP methyl ester carboxylesterase
LDTSGCTDPGYRLQGYSDSDYRNVDGPEYAFGDWTDASGAPVSLRDYAGEITGTAFGSINPPDYYALIFGSCDFSRAVNIAAAPNADYVCTDNAGPFNNYCYTSDVVGAPFMTLAAQEFIREPVVIVPGIMGSRLNATADGTEVWPNAGAMILSGADSYLDALKLSPAGGEIPGKEMYPSDIIRTVTTSIPFVGADLYKPLIDALIGDGYEEGKDLFVAPYDWRLDIPSSAASVGAVIKNAVAHSPNGKINIIAHSMGGLVAAEYLVRATSTAFLDKLILAGAPQLGAPEIFKGLEYGDDLGFNILGLVSLLNPREVKSISQNMPGVYDLLPSRRYVGIEGSYIFDKRDGSTAPFSFDLDQTNQFMTSDPNDSRNGALLAAADAFHARADAASVNAPAVYNLVGCQNPATIKNFILQDGGAVDIVRGNGDGSVPVDSAMNLANGYQNYFSLYSENGADHVGLVRDSRPIALIRAIIRNATATLSLAPLGISTSSEDCLQGRSQHHNGTTVEVTARGPVALNVYDEGDRHTGPNADGGIDLQVPGSSYQAIGPNSFILLPASSTYRVVAQGTSASASSTASSSATFGIRRYDDASDLINSATYVEIPIYSASATVTFTVTSSTPAPPISLDTMGTGLPDTPPIPPTALLDASSSRDHDPPVITVFGIPTNATIGTTATVTFSFADAGTGIATSSATMNGIPLASGSTITFDTAGTATFRFSAEDNAGNPALREYRVPVLPAGALPVGGACRAPGSS